MVILRSGGKATVALARAYLLCKMLFRAAAAAAAAVVLPVFFSEGSCCVEGERGWLV